MRGEVRAETLLLVASLLLLALMLSIFVSVMLRFVGIYVVASGSMEPSIPVSSIVIILRVDPLAYSVGDVVLFEYRYGNRSIPVLHRVIEIDRDRGVVVTKGDAKRFPEFNRFSDVIGVLVLGIPYATMPYLLLRRSPYLVYAAIAALVALYLTSVVAEAGEEG